MIKLISLDPPDCPAEDQRPIETYPGYLGIEESGELSSEFPSLIKFSGLNFNAMYAGSYETTSTHKIALKGETSPLNISLNIDCMSNLLDQLPSIEVATDNGYFILFLADGYSVKSMEEQVIELVTWLSSFPEI